MVNLHNSWLIVFFSAGHLRDLEQSFPLQKEHFVFDVSDVPSFDFSFLFAFALAFLFPDTFESIMPLQTRRAQSDVSAPL